MTKYSLIMAVSLLFAMMAPLPSAAATPPLHNAEGEWLVKDKTAHMRILPCGSKLWGVISWTQTPDTDKNNPDISRRSDPVLGLPILLGMQPGTPGQWNGRIYNAQNGKIYDGDIRLRSENVLHIEGCVLGILCGGENWTRLEPGPKPEPAEKICKRLQKFYPDLF